MSLLKALFGSNLGRALLLGVVVAALAALGKYYWDDYSRSDHAREGEAEKHKGEEAVEALEAYLEAHASDERPWPADTDWTPSVLPCGRATRVPEAEAAHPTWKALGMSFERETRYQLRFGASGARFELLARTDADCDGIHEVVRRSGQIGLTGALTEGPLKVDNPGE